MKKFQLMWMVLVLWFCWFLMGCSSETNNDAAVNEELFVYDPVSEYNNKLTDIVNVCYSWAVSTQEQYNKYREWNSIDKVQKSIEETLLVCNNSINQINSLWSWEWDASLRDAAIILLDKVVNKLTLLQDTLPYLERVEDLTPQEVSEHNSLVDELNSNDLDMQQIVDNMEYVQQDFVQRYGLTMVE